MKFLERGDVIRKLGSTYIVMYRTDTVIYYINFDVDTRKSGGGGNHHTNYSGTKNNEIVEYLGFYSHLHAPNRPYAFMRHV